PRAAARAVARHCEQIPGPPGSTVALPGPASSLARRARRCAVSRRPGRDGQGDPPDDADAEAAAASSAIAGLPPRLGRLRTFDHPVVRRELRKLEEELAVLYEQATPNPGRHRASSAPDKPGSMM